MAARRDYYEILGVDRGVDEASLKGAYRKMALKYHPDRNAGDKQAEEQFKQAAEAYGVLSDPSKRAVYDRYGHQGLQSSGAGPGFDPAVFTEFSDIFDVFGLGDLFGFGGGRRGRAQRGEDIRYDLEIQFEDAIRGSTIDIQVPRQDPCPRCHASGAEPRDGLTPCPMCRGRGEVVYQQAFLSIRRTCSQCGGSGQIIRRPCTQCRGQRFLHSERKRTLNIPAGVDSGTQLRLAGEGMPGPAGAPPGDLYVVLKVREHPIFERHEHDLHCLIPVNVAQATLGAVVDLLTFDGLQAVRIPESSQSGARIRLRGLGVPHVNGNGRGDIIIHVEVRVPTRLTREQKKLFEQLRETLPAENEPEEKGLFEKVRDWAGL